MAGRKFTTRITPPRRVPISSYAVEHSAVTATVPPAAIFETQPHYHAWSRDFFSAKDLDLGPCETKEAAIQLGRDHLLTTLRVRAREVSPGVVLMETETPHTVRVRACTNGECIRAAVLQRLEEDR